ncbi:hypothetical protein Efla_000274 [Eimeria flavescens]
MQPPAVQDAYSAAAEELPPSAFPSLGCLESRRLIDLPFSVPPVGASAGRSQQRRQQRQKPPEGGSGDAAEQPAAAADLSATGAPRESIHQHEEGAGGSLLTGLLRRLLPGQQQQQQQQGAADLAIRLGFEVPICGVPEAASLCTQWAGAGRLQVERSERCVSVTSWAGQHVFLWLLWPSTASSPSEAAEATAAAAAAPAAAAGGTGAAYVYEAGEAVLSCSLVEAFSVLAITYDTQPTRTELLLLPPLLPSTCSPSSSSSKSRSRSKGGGGSVMEPQPLKPLRRLLLPRADIVLQWVGGCSLGVLFLCFCRQSRDGALMLLHAGALAAQHRLAADEQQQKQQQVEEAGAALVAKGPPEAGTQLLPPVRLSAEEFSSVWLPQTPFPPCSVCVHPTLPIAVVVGFRAEDKCGWSCWVPLLGTTREPAEVEADSEEFATEEGDPADRETRLGFPFREGLRSASSQLPGTSDAGGAPPAAPAPVAALFPCLDLFRSLAARQALDALDAYRQQQQQQRRKGAGEQQLQRGEAAWRRADSPESFYGPVFLKVREVGLETERWLAAAESPSHTVPPAPGRPTETAGQQRETQQQQRGQQQQPGPTPTAKAQRRREALLVELRERLSSRENSGKQKDQQLQQHLLKHVALSRCGALVALTLPSDEVLLLRLTTEEQQQQDGSSGDSSSSSAAAAYYEPLAFLPSPFLWHISSRAANTQQQQRSQAAVAAVSEIQQQTAEQGGARLRKCRPGQKEELGQQQHADQEEQQQQQPEDEQSSEDDEAAWLEEEVAFLQLSSPPRPAPLAASFFAGELSELLMLLFCDPSPLDGEQQQQQQHESTTSHEALGADDLRRPSGLLCVAFDLDRNSLLLSPLSGSSSTSSSSRYSGGGSTEWRWAAVDGSFGRAALPLALLPPLGSAEPFGAAGSDPGQQENDTLLLLSVEEVAGGRSRRGDADSSDQQQQADFRLSLSAMRCGDVACFAAAAAARGAWDEAEGLLQDALSISRQAHQAAAAAAAAAAARMQEGDSSLLFQRTEDEVQRVAEALAELQTARWAERGKDPRASEADFQAAFRCVETAAASSSSSPLWLLQEALQYDPFAASTADFGAAAAELAAANAGAWTPDLLPLRRLRLLLQRALQQQKQQREAAQQQAEGRAASLEAAAASMLKDVDVLIALCEEAVGGERDSTPAAGPAATTAGTTTAAATAKAGAAAALGAAATMTLRQNSPQQRVKQPSAHSESGPGDVSEEVEGLLLQQLQRALSALLLRGEPEAEADREETPFVLRLASTFAAHSQTLAVELLLQQHQQLHPHWATILSAFPEALPPHHFLHLLPQTSTSSSSSSGSSSSRLEASCEAVVAWTAQRCLAIMRGPGLLLHCALPLISLVPQVLQRPLPAAVAAASAALRQQEQQARKALTVARLDPEQQQRLRQQEQLKQQQLKQQQEQAAAAAVGASLAAAVLAAGSRPSPSPPPASASLGGAASSVRAASAASAFSSAALAAATGCGGLSASACALSENPLLLPSSAVADKRQARQIRPLLVLHGLLRQFLVLQLLQLRCRELQQQQQQQLPASGPLSRGPRKSAGAKQQRQKLQHKLALLEDATEDFWCFLQLPDVSRMLLLLLHLVASQQQLQGGDAAVAAPRPHRADGSGSSSSSQQDSNSSTFAKLKKMEDALAANAVELLVEPIVTVERLMASGENPRAEASPPTANCQQHEQPQQQQQQQQQIQEDLLMQALDGCFAEGVLHDLCMCLAVEAADAVSAAGALRASRLSAVAAVKAVEAAGPEGGGLMGNAAAVTEGTALQLLPWALLLFASRCSASGLPSSARLVPSPRLLLQLALLLAYRKGSTLAAAAAAPFLRALVGPALRQLRQPQQQHEVPWEGMHFAEAAAAAARAAAAATGVSLPADEDLEKEASLLLHHTDAIAAALQLIKGPVEGPSLRVTLLDLQAASFNKEAAERLLLPLLQHAVWQQQLASSRSSSGLKSAEESATQWRLLFSRAVDVHRKLSMALQPTELLRRLALLLASLPPLPSRGALLQSQQQQLQHPLLLLLPVWRETALLSGDATTAEFADSCCRVLLQTAQRLLDEAPNGGAGQAALAVASLQSAAAAAGDALAALQQQQELQQLHSRLARLRAAIEDEQRLQAVVTLLYELQQQQQQQHRAAFSALGAASAAAASAAAAAAAAAEAALSRARGAALNVLLSTEEEEDGEEEDEQCCSTASGADSQHLQMKALARKEGEAATAAGADPAAAATAASTAAATAAAIGLLARPSALRQQLKTPNGRQELLSVLLRLQPLLSLQQQEKMKELGRLLSLAAPRQQLMLDVSRGAAYLALGEKESAATVVTTLLAAELQRRQTAAAAAAAAAEAEASAGGEPTKRKEASWVVEASPKRLRAADSAAGAPTSAAAHSPQPYTEVREGAGGGNAVSEPPLSAAGHEEEPELASLGEAVATDMVQQGAPRLASSVLAAAVCAAADEQLPELLRSVAAARAAFAAAADAAAGAGVAAPGEETTAGAKQQGAYLSCWEPDTAADLLRPPGEAKGNLAKGAASTVALCPSASSAFWMHTTAPRRSSSNSSSSSGSSSTSRGTHVYSMARSVLRLMGEGDALKSSTGGAAGRGAAPSSFLFLSAFEAAGGAVASAAASAKQLYSAALAAEAAADTLQRQHQQEQQFPKARALRHPATTRTAVTAAATAEAAAAAAAEARELRQLRKVMEGSSKADLIAAAFSQSLGSPKELLLHPQSWSSAAVPRTAIDCGPLLRRDGNAAVLLLSTAATAAAAGAAPPDMAPGLDACDMSEEQGAQGRAQLMLGAASPATCAALLQTAGLTAADMVLVVQQLLLLAVLPLLLLSAPFEGRLERLATALLLLLRFLRRVPAQLSTSVDGGSASSNNNEEDAAPSCACQAARLVADGAYRRQALLQLGAADSSLIDAAAAAIAAAGPLSEPLSATLLLQPKKTSRLCSSRVTVPPGVTTVSQPRHQQQQQQQAQADKETAGSQERNSRPASSPASIDNEEDAGDEASRGLGSAGPVPPASTENDLPLQDQPRQQQGESSLAAVGRLGKVSGDGFKVGEAEGQALAEEGLEGEGLGLRLEHMKKVLLLNAAPVSEAVVMSLSSSISLLLRAAPAAFASMLVDSLAALLQTNSPGSPSLLHPRAVRVLCCQAQEQHQQSGLAAPSIKDISGPSPSDSVPCCRLPFDEFQQRILLIRRLFASCIRELQCEPAMLLEPAVRRAATASFLSAADECQMAAAHISEEVTLQVARCIAETAGLGRLEDEDILGTLHVGAPSIDLAALHLPPPKLFTISPSCCMASLDARKDPEDEGVKAVVAEDPFAISVEAAAEQSNVCLLLSLRQRMRCLEERTAAASICISVLKKCMQELQCQIDCGGFDVLEDWELLSSDKDTSRPLHEDRLQPSPPPDSAELRVVGGNCVDLVSLLLHELPREEWTKLLEGVEPFGAAIQLSIALRMSHYLKNQQAQQEQEDSSERETPDKGLKRLLERLVAVLPFAAAWERRVGGSAPFLSAESSLAEICVDILTSPDESSYQAFSASFWRLVCRHMLALRPQQTGIKEGTNQRAVVLSDLAAFLCGGLSAWFTQRLPGADMRQKVQQRSAVEWGEGHREVEQSLERLLVRALQVPLKSSCETLAFNFFLLRQITGRVLPSEHKAHSTGYAYPWQLLTDFAMIKVLLRHAEALRKNIGVLTPEQKSSLESLVKDCIRAISELQHEQENNLERLATCAFFPELPNLAGKFGPLEAAAAFDRGSDALDVAQFVLRLLSDRGGQLSDFSAAGCGLRLRCAFLLLWGNKESHQVTNAISEAETLLWSPLWSDTYLEEPDASRVDIAVSSHDRGDVRVHEQCAVWRALLETGASLEERMFLRLLAGRHAANEVSERGRLQGLCTAQLNCLNDTVPRLCCRLILNGKVDLRLACC